MSNDRRSMSDKEKMRRRSMKQRRRAQAIRRRNRVLAGITMGIIVVILLLVLLVRTFTQSVEEVLEENASEAATVSDVDEDVDIVAMPDIVEDLLTINEYSRPGTAIEEVQNIVIHYTGNPGTTAEQNVSYYESLHVTEETSVSSNFVVGMDGVIIMCVPTDEVAYASNWANSTSLSIEVCHEDVTGAFTEEAYESTVHLTAWLCEQFDLEAEDVIRHYDVTGKACPIYYVENEDEWLAFKADVDSMLKGELVY